MSETTYQKVLQLYRSTNIWDTKNMAKAEIEKHAKQLHPEIGESPIDKYLRDGEPIISKYYDKGEEGYTYLFSYLLLNSDPYTTTNSATHIWIDGFDSFTDEEFDPVTSKIKGKTPDYNSAAYIRVSSNGSYNWYKLILNLETPQTDTRNEKAVFGVALINNSKYYIEWFDSVEEAVGAGLEIINNVINVKLANDGGIEFNPEEYGNKSLKIKINNANEYYEKLPDSSNATHRYEPNNPNADAYGYVTIAQATAEATGYYRKNTYLKTDSNGLSLNGGVLENKIGDDIGKILYVNNQKFNKDENGYFKSIVTGNDINVAGNGSTINSTMTLITPVEGTQVVLDNLPIPSENSPSIVYNTSDAYLYELKVISDVYSYEKLRVDENPIYIELNGLIYKFDTIGYKLFSINDDTNLNDAISILNYLTYNLDMGRFVV